MPDIVIRTVPHTEQRYDTVGDWMFRTTGSLQVRVSELGDWRMEALVAVHEVIEALLCKARGISEESVTEFDTSPEGLASAESGDHPDASYRREHFFATSIERLLCAEFGVDWAEYGAAIDALPNIPSPERSHSLEAPATET